MRCVYVYATVENGPGPKWFGPVLTLHFKQNAEERFKQACSEVGKGLGPFFDEHVHKNPQADKVLGGFYRYNFTIRDWS